MQNRSQLILGVLLILAGAWFLARQSIPSLTEWSEQFFRWPYTLMWIGGFILLLGLLTSNPGAAVPATIVAGIGVIFYINDRYAGGQSAWAYTWTLIPGFVGLGSILAALLGDSPRQNLRHGLNLVVISVVAFLVLGSIFQGLTFLPKEYGPAILLIALGLWFIGRGLWRSFSRRGD